MSLGTVFLVDFMAGKKFPEGFLWGTAISAFQVEMGRGEPSDKTDWWAWVHDKGIQEGITSGDTPMDGPGFWELYDEDFRLIKDDLKCQSVRMSIDWGRLFPESTEDIEVDVTLDDHGNVVSVNIDKYVIQALSVKAKRSSVKRYREILESAKSRGLTVMLTLFHWQIPLWLHDPIAVHKDVESTDKRGWLDNRTLVEFSKLVAFIAHEYGDVVDLYNTINEPRIISEHGYLSAHYEFPPGKYDAGLYLKVMKNLAIAHGLAYEQVKKWDTKSYSDLGPCTVGLVPVLQVFTPYDKGNPKDVEASKLIDYAFNEWGLNAVIHGDYDMNLDYIIQPEEQLPHLVKGCDFFGVNYYSRWHISHVDRSDVPLENFKLMPCEGDCTDYGWEVYPEGIREVVNWAFKRYRRPIYITENGIADETGDQRDRYLKVHIEKLHQAIVEDGVPVLGYYHWTMMDNFEWSDGYRIRFGLYQVDMKTKQRSPTKTVRLYREIITSNSPV